MRNDFSKALFLFQSGKLDEAKNICEEILKQESSNSQVINLYAFILYYEKKFHESIEQWQQAIKINPNYKEALNGCGNAYKNLNKLNEAVKNFKKAIHIDPKYLEAYLNLANVYIKLEQFDEAIDIFNKSIELDNTSSQAYQGKGLGLMKSKKFDEAILNFKESILLNPNDANVFFNLAATYEKIEEWEEAVDCFVKTLKLNPGHRDAYENLLNLLEFYFPKKNYENFIVKTNNLLKQNNLNIDLNTEISDEKIINLYSKISEILGKNFYNNFLNDKSQIFRINTDDLNFKRHFEIFNTFNVIPKFCFECYKIQINLKNVLELFKLYVVFDKIKLNKNNQRKCMIETRPKVEGNYKGLIYCSGLSEARDIIKYLLPITKKTIRDDLSIFIKRGCTEFAVSYPKYKEIDNSMKYNEDWVEKEKIIDEKNKNKNLNNPSQETLTGLSITDGLIMQNWLSFAKSINDESYKKFRTDIIDSKYLKNKLSGQIQHRMDEFKKINF